MTPGDPQPSDREEPLPAETVGLPPDADARDRQYLAAALRGLYRAYQKLSIYPPGHPAVPCALGDAALDFKKLLRERSISIAVTPDQVRVGGEALTEASGALKSLAQLLHDLDVAGLEFKAGLDTEELQCFVDALRRARADGTRGAALVAALSELNLLHVSVVPLDYGALSFAEGARDATEPKVDVWDSVLTQLGDPASVDPVVSQLAREVGEHILRQEGTGVSALRARLRKVNSRIAALDPTQRAALRRRLSEFVSALNPDLRGDLLRVDPKRPAEALTFMAEMAENLPEPDLLDALQEIDRVGGRVPEAVLTLMNKLVRISVERPSFAAGLSDTLTKWGVSPATIEDSGTTDLRSALEEVFQVRVEVDCNPQSYQELLDDLSHAELDTSQATLQSRYRDPRDLVDARRHAAEIAALVLNKPGGDAYRASLLGYIATASNTLIAERAFWALRDAAVAARAYAMLPGEKADTRLAATRYLDEFSNPERAARVLKSACSGPRLPPEALSLVGLGGLAALEQALDALDRERRFEVAEALRRFLAAAGRDEVERLIEAREAGGWPRLRPVFQVLLRLEPVEAVALARKLLAHPDWRVRREALLTTCELEPKSGATEQRLQAALGDPDERVGLAAVDRLARAGTRRAMETLGLHLRDAPGRSSAVALRIVATLAAGGPHGLRQLCDCLERLRWSLDPARIAVARAAIEALAAHESNPEVAQALRRWRWSLVGLVGGSRARRAGRGPAR